MQTVHKNIKQNVLSCEEADLWSMEKSLLPGQLQCQEKINIRKKKFVIIPSTLCKKERPPED